MSISRLYDEFLPRSLRFAIKTYRVGWIAFGVGLTLRTVEYVIGAEMNKPRILVLANFRDNARGFRVDPKGLVTLPLTKIDIRKRGCINENIEIDHAHFLAHLIEAFEIELEMLEAGDVELVVIFTHERRA